MAQQQPRARVLSSTDLDDLMRTRADALSQAERMIVDAKAEAARIEREARARAKQDDHDLRERCDKRLQAFIDKDKLERHTAMMASLASEITAIRRQHTELLPWLIRLVRTSVERVVGALDDVELVARMVEQGVGNLDQSYRVGIRVHPLDVARVTEAMELHPASFSVVDEVLPDQSLDRGAIHMDCSAGTIDVSLATQIDAICAALASLPDDASGPEATR